MDATEVAVRLYTDLHSSARENFMTSLLTASLNECETLREWLVFDKAKLHRGLDIDNFQASANDTIPELIRGEGKKRYKFTDIIVWKPQEREYWDVLHWRFLGDKRPKPSKIKEAMQSLHAVYVEVKHTYLSEEDKDKYVSFLEAISEAKNIRFIVVSSHNEVALERLKKGPSSDLLRKERPWHVLLNTPGVIHVTAQELYSYGLDQYKGKSYSVTPILKAYLRLVVNPGAPESWKYRFRYYHLTKDLSELREAILDDVLAIAAKWGFYRGNRNVRLSNVGNIQTIEKSEGYSLRLMKHPSWRPGDKIKIGFGDAGHKSVTFCPSSGMKPKSVATKMAQIEHNFGDLAHKLTKR